MRGEGAAKGIGDLALAVSVIAERSVKAVPDMVDSF